MADNLITKKKQKKIHSTINGKSNQTPKVIDFVSPNKFFIRLLLLFSKRFAFEQDISLTTRLYPSTDVRG